MRPIGIQNEGYQNSERGLSKSRMRFIGIQNAIYQNREQGLSESGMRLIRIETKPFGVWKAYGLREGRCETWRRLREWNQLWSLDRGGFGFWKEGESEIGNKANQDPEEDEAENLDPGYDNED
jgi:hypothetical protein